MNLKDIGFGGILIAVVLLSMEKLSLFVYNEAKDASFLGGNEAFLLFKRLIINPICEIYL